MKQIFGLLTFVLMAQTILSQTQPTNNTSWSTTKKIGIGATAPFYWLDVNAPASFAGTHADSPNLNYLPNTGKLLIVRNHNGAGEIVFLGNRGSGSVGGFNFYDYPNSGSTIKNLLSVDGAGHLSIGAISGYTNTNTSLNSGIANFRIYSLSQPLAQISSPNGDLNMSLNSTNDALFKNTSTISRNMILHMPNNNNDGNFYINFSSDRIGGNNILTIYNNGKVGIGTSALGTCTLAVEGKWVQEKFL